MAKNTRKKSFFEMCSFQHRFLKAFAKRYGLTVDHLIGKIVRRKIRDEVQEKTKKK
jgi:hypothetical protein